MSVASVRKLGSAKSFKIGVYVLAAVVLFAAGAIVGKTMFGSDRQLIGVLDFWATGQYGCIKDGGETVCGAIVLPDGSEFRSFEGKTVSATVRQLHGGIDDIQIIWVHNVK